MSKKRAKQLKKDFERLAGRPFRSGIIGKDGEFLVVSEWRQLKKLYKNWK